MVVAPKERPILVSTLGVHRDQEYQGKKQHNHDTFETEWVGVVLLLTFLLPQHNHDTFEVYGMEEEG